MAVYYCESCDTYMDNDYHPCEEWIGGLLVCPDCFEELTAEYYEWAEELESEDYRKPKVPFDKSQHFDPETGELKR